VERIMKRILAGLLIGMFWQSGPALAEAKISGRASLGNMPVSWSSVGARTARQMGVAAPATLIMFSFSPMTTGTSVSEAQWAKEAARLGVDVATATHLLGSSVYVTKAGNLASCTMGAIEKGFCGRPTTLSVTQRAAAAKSIVEQTGRCTWTGFDEGLNARLASELGAGDHTLWVAADCR
jgi:hypothetical protein